MKTALWMARHLDGVPGVTVQELISELEGQVIERLLVQYKIEGNMWPLPFLFGVPNGGIRNWARYYVYQRQRDRDMFRLYGATLEQGRTDLEEATDALNATLTDHQVAQAPREFETPDLDAELDRRHEVKEYQAAVDHVEDGVTLPLDEYRALRFCLSHGGVHSMNTNGLHRHLSEVTHYKRQTITRHYRKATMKLIERAGKTDEVLRTKGITPTGVDRARRRRWIFGIRDDSDRLTEEEVCGLLKQAEITDTLADVLWAYGTSNRMYHKLRGTYER